MSRVQTPNYRGLAPASAKASRSASAASKKTDTRCEVTLRRALWGAGARFRKNVSSLPGHPDIVFAGRRLVVFCDGDFWHGRDWSDRRRRLLAGSNAAYWISKLSANRRRDRLQVKELRAEGWTVLRFWESDINRDPARIAEEILCILRA